MKKYIFISLFVFSGLTNTKAQDCSTVVNPSDSTAQNENLTVSDKEELIVTKKGKTYSHNNYSLSSTSFLLYRDKETNAGLIELRLTSLDTFQLEKGDLLFFKTVKENVVNLEIPEEITAHQIPDKWEIIVTMPIEDSSYSTLNEEKISRFILFPRRYYKKIKNQGENILDEYLKCVLR